MEPDRWYYHADRLGLLVWQDMPSMCGARVDTWSARLPACPAVGYHLFAVHAQGNAAIHACCVTPGALLTHGNPVSEHACINLPLHHLTFFQQIGNVAFSMSGLYYQVAVPAISSAFTLFVGFCTSQLPSAFVPGCSRSRIIKLCCHWLAYSCTQVLSGQVCGLLDRKPHHQCSGQGKF